MDNMSRKMAPVARGFACQAHFSLSLMDARFQSCLTLVFDKRVKIEKACCICWIYNRPNRVTHECLKNGNVRVSGSREIVG